MNGFDQFPFWIRFGVVALSILMFGFYTRRYQDKPQTSRTYAAIAVFACLLFGGILLIFQLFS